MAITLRNVTGSALTYNQLDTNFSSFFYSASISGLTLTLFTTGSTGLEGVPAPASMSVNISSISNWTSSASGISRSGSVTVEGSFANGPNGTEASGSYSLAQGGSAKAYGEYSHAEGSSTTAYAPYSHTEGSGTRTYGTGSHAEGGSTTTLGNYSHAEGVETYSTGERSHAEGYRTVAYGTGSHAEGYGSIASGSHAHAEGYETKAPGPYSHAEGYLTVASGSYSHAEGFNTLASGQGAHAEGFGTKALGAQSHAEGYSTVASGSYQHVQGKFNISSSVESAFIIGNGESDDKRANLVFASGQDFQITGSLGVSGTATLNGALYLKPIHPLPAGVGGMLAVSASGARYSLYYHDGVDWTSLY